MCNFPQEIYRGTSLPAAVPSSVSPLSRGAGHEGDRARPASAFLSSHFFLPLPRHPRHPFRTLFLLSRSERTSLVRVPLPVLAILHPSIDDAKAKGERGGWRWGLVAEGRRRPSLSLSILPLNSSAHPSRPSTAVAFSLPPSSPRCRLCLRR